VPLVRLAAFQSIDKCLRSGVIGFPISRSFSRFHAESTVFFVSHRPPHHLRNVGSSSRTLRPSTEYFLTRSAKNPRIPSAFLGVRGPSSRRQQSAYMQKARPSASCLSVLGVLHALDGFLRGLPCGFISPHCHVQGSLFRGLLLVHSRIAFQQPLPSCRCLDFAIGSCPPTPRHRASPSGLCSASESGSRTERG